MKKRKIILLLILIGTLLVDQFTKYLVSSNMNVNESISIIDSFFYITYARNTGAAWSMLEGKMIFFYIITIVALLFMVFFYRTLDKEDIFSKIGIVLMISGTLGNFIDRIFLKYVRDFLDFIIFGYDFPIFNVADMCLCIGIGCLLLSMYMEDVGVKLWKRKDIK